LKSSIFAGKTQLIYKRLEFQVMEK